MLSDRDHTLHEALYCCCLVVKSCPTLCNPMDCSPPGSSVRGILQARTLEWVPFPPPEDLPNPGIEPMSPSLASGFFTTEPSGKPIMVVHLSLIRVLASGIAPQRHSFFPFPMDEMSSQERPCKRRSKMLDLGYEAWTLDMSHQWANKCLLITHWT